MLIILTVTAGPHQGKEFRFTERDSFLVGRSISAHFALPRDDPYFSRKHFLVEVNPPRCRVLDLASHNGTYVNGARISAAELHDGDEIRAGHTILRVSVPRGGPNDTASLPTIPPNASRWPTTEPAAQPATTARLPEIPGYRIEGEIGRGGMGVVYRAARAADDEVVAIKTIAPAVADQPAHVERFLREVRILERLRHRHIVAFHEMGEADGLLYFVTEFVPGTDAARLVRRGALPVPVAVRIACQLLTALAYAHGQGFVHRDIKPANLLIESRKGRRAVKLADFGLARVYNASQLSGPTLQGELAGTPAYMAPEQITHYREAKPAADQYSAAATLYNLLTGSYPHDHDPDAMVRLVRIVTDPPVPLRQRRPDLPEALAAEVERALAREPEDRFPDVSAFRCALEPFGH